MQVCSCGLGFIIHQFVLVLLLELTTRVDYDGIEDSRLENTSH